MESGRLLRRETEVSNRRNCHLFLLRNAAIVGMRERERGGGSGGRRGKFEDRLVIDSGQYGCAQVSLLLFVGRVTQAVAPASAHSCKVKTVGPSTLGPSIRPYHLSLPPSLSLVSDNRSRRVVAPLHFFARPSLTPYRFPGYK